MVDCHPLLSMTKTALVEWALKSTDAVVVKDSGSKVSSEDRQDVQH